MNRTIKEATVRRFHYDSHDDLRDHLNNFITAYNFARRLKTLKVSPLTNSSANAGQKSRIASTSIQIHQMPGPNS